MHKLCTTILTLLTAATVLAQAPTGRNTSTYHTGLDTARSVDIRERLVQLALQNPNYEIADRKVNVASYELSKSKGAWLGLLSASGNLNELSIKGNKENTSTPGVTNSNIFYPRYNFSLNLPLDFFTSKGNDVRAAREKVYSAEAENNEKYSKE